MKALSLLAGINDTDALYQEMYQASISYEGMTDEEIFFDDYKEYEGGGRQFGIGCVNAYDEDSAKDLAERMANVLSSFEVPNDMNIAFQYI